MNQLQKLMDQLHYHQELMDQLQKLMDQLHYHQELMNLLQPLWHHQAMVMLLLGTPEPHRQVLGARAMCPRQPRLLPNKSLCQYL